MTIVLVGLDHQSAPIEVRERVFVGDPDLGDVLVRLRALELAEVAVLSTCNRFDVLAITQNAAAAVPQIEANIARLAGMPLDALRPHLYALRDQQAVRRLFRVAAGLESLVLGETQIMGQVAAAGAAARQAGCAGPILTRLFMTGLHVGKRARAETGISQHTLSISHAAAWLLRREAGELATRHALVIGAGEMAGLAARALRRQGAQRLTIMSRTLASATRLAKRVGASALAWSQLDAALADADVVVAAAGVSQPVISAEAVARAMERRPVRPMTVVDIGVPRNLEVAAAGVAGVRAYAIDDLRDIVAEHRSLREAEIAPVERIIAAEVRQFVHWQRTRSIVPVITSMRHQAEAIARAEVELAVRRLPELDDHGRDIVAQMATRIVNKLLHNPTVTLRERAARGDHFDYSHATRKLFALDGMEAERERVDADE